MKSILGLPNVRLLLYLYDKREARYSDLLENVVQSRSTLALNLRELNEDQLIERQVAATRPIQTRYRLTPKGNSIAKHLAEMRQTV